MKKVVSLILCVTFCAMMLMGCGQTETPAPSADNKSGLNTITYTQYASGGVETQL